MSDKNLQRYNGPPSTAIAVANWFLQRSWKEPSLPRCDQLKLQKLVYYAQAWYLANFNKPLFSEDIEAWPHGPVVRDLYLQFMNFGRNQITTLGTRLEKRENGYVTVTPEHDGSLDYFLDVIWDRYKRCSGVQLSNATHKEGEPWEIVSCFYDLEEKPTIPIEIIRSVFSGKISRSSSE
ncbi:MAG: DUF4065 domain-containing protein [Aestuariivita sp.]|nr:DUF4065 domain-containing protein [Aestuariivita sp.]